MTTRTGNPKSNTDPKQRKTNAILKYLRDAGYRPKVHRVGFISFTKEEGWYVCLTEKQDTPFLKLTLYNVAEIPGQMPVYKVLWAMNKVNMVYKVIKLTFDDKMVSASADLLLYPASSVARALPRVINVLAGMDDAFAKALAKAPDAPTVTASARKRAGDRRSRAKRKSVAGKG